MPTALSGWLFFLRSQIVHVLSLPYLLTNRRLAAPWRAARACAVAVRTVLSLISSTLHRTGGWELDGGLQSLCGGGACALLAEDAQVCRAPTAQAPATALACQCELLHGHAVRAPRLIGRRGGGGAANATGRRSGAEAVAGRGCGRGGRRVLWGGGAARRPRRRRIRWPAAALRAVTRRGGGCRRWRRSEPCTRCARGCRRLPGAPRTPANGQRHLLTDIHRRHGARDSSTSPSSGGGREREVERLR